ncbi:unnamed protein product [Effrenium voratum]|uniref:Uncharacterized protein n=1 Tax=Effrenium voratum TaxID=2562239 RepID=A0AA36MWX1_9DINO|nr:unnamed protein product [Effrenium voratum]
MENEGQRKAPPSLRRRGSQPRQAPKPPSENQLKAREAEVQRAAARQLWEAFGGPAGADSVQQLLAEVPLSEALRLASDAQAGSDWCESVLSLGKVRHGEACQRVLEQRKAQLLASLA